MVLHLKRFKVDMTLQTMRKIAERVAWEKRIDVSALCLSDARPPVALQEPERAAAKIVAAEIASSDPQGLHSSVDDKVFDDVDGADGACV